jgi:carbon-monoxide dehydrogenase medium subunit
MSGEREPTSSDEVDYYAPESIPAAQRRLADTDGFVKVLAGGQTLSLLLGQGLLDADALVDVGDIPSLSGVTAEDERAEIGAATTYAALRESALTDRIGALADACSVVGDRQVRTMGTVGGAVCHADPALDVVAVFQALDATLTVGSIAGRRTAPIDDFLVSHMRTDLDDEELLESITVDVPGAQTGTAYEKHAAVETTWATVGAAAWLTVESGTIIDARVALTAVADTAVRSPVVEAALVGEPAAQESLAAASEEVVEDIDPIDDGAASAAYKRKLAPTIVERSLVRSLERAGDSS